MGLRKQSPYRELLEILACPKCKGEVVLLEKDHGLLCRDCQLVYPIRHGIPIMLIDEAKLDSNETVRVENQQDKGLP